MRHYYAMYVDELGDEHRYNSETYEFPSFNSDDEILYNAFLAWKLSIEVALNATANAEIRVFLDRDDHEKYSGYCNDYFEW